MYTHLIILRLRVVYMNTCCTISPKLQGCIHIFAPSSSLNVTKKWGDLRVTQGFLCYCRFLKDDSVNLCKSLCFLFDNFRQIVTFYYLNSSVKWKSILTTKPFSVSTKLRWNGLDTKLGNLWINGSTTWDSKRSYKARDVFFLLNIYKIHVIARI